LAAGLSSELFESLGFLACPPLADFSGEVDVVLDRGGLRRWDGASVSP